MRINALNYPTLQNALDDARDGDRIYLPASGDYTAPAGGFRITKQIEFYGEGTGPSGTVLRPHAADPVLIVDPTDLDALENIYLHDFRIEGPGGGDGVQCLTTIDDKVGNMRVERVRVSDLGGIGFAFLGTLTFGSKGAVVNPRLYGCIAEKCAGGGALFRKTFLGNVTQCRFADGGVTMTGSALLKAEFSALALYGCLFEGNQATTSQLEFDACVAPRVDACRFMNFPTGAAQSAMRITTSQGGVVGSCYFELAGSAPGSKGIFVVPHPDEAGPVLILPNRFGNVENLVYMESAGSTNVKAAVVTPQFDGSSSGKMVLPIGTNRGLVAVPAMSRAGSNAGAGMALPSDGTAGQDPPYNQTDGTLSYRFVSASSRGEIRAYIDDDWQTVRIGPAPVTDLRIGGRGRYSLALYWSAPPAGATSYVLKRSTSPITEANFDAAADVPNLPAPGPPGAQECVVNLGLSDCTLFYFAMKSVDAQSRKSPMSNLASGSTRCSGTSVAECL